MTDRRDAMCLFVYEKMAAAGALALITVKPWPEAGISDFAFFEFEYDEAKMLAQPTIRMEVSFPGSARHSSITPTSLRAAQVAKRRVAGPLLDRLVAGGSVNVSLSSAEGESDYATFMDPAHFADSWLWTMTIRVLIPVPSTLATYP